MKFATVTFALFSLILGAQSRVLSSGSLLGLNLHGLGLGLNPLGVAPVGLGISGLGLGIGGINNIGLNTLLGPLGLGYRADLSGLSGVSVGLPGQSLSQGAIDISGHGLGAIVPHGASYVARTRGAIHTAPLAGHINSAASVNVDPAPGTL